MKQGVERSILLIYLRLRRRLSRCPVKLKYIGLFWERGPPKQSHDHYNSTQHRPSIKLTNTFLNAQKFLGKIQSLGSLQTLQGN